MEPTQPSQWRPPTTYEVELLKKLLSVPFVGSQELCLQLPGLTVRDILPDGTIELSTMTGESAPGLERNPIVGRCDDPSGNPFEVLLHVHDGRLAMLEFIAYGDCDPAFRPAVAAVVPAATH